MANDTIQAFSQFIAQVEDGELHADLSREMETIVATLNDTYRDAGGKPKASLTLTFDLTLDQGVVEVRGDFRVKLPRAVRGRSLFWTTPDNRLSTRNPRQTELPLRDVTPELPNAGRGEVRAV